ncbi:MAG: hypothetical protein IJ264_05540, partial [Clostridia bacterium]|nr:hypothetical protein [Clostridia bacterium]
MLNKIISIFMSFAISVTGLIYTSMNNFLDSVTEMIFGIPYTVDSVNSDFFDEITDSDVVSVDEDSGFVEDMAAIFIDENLSFTEKISLFNRCGGSIIGWCAPIDLYVMRFSS